MSLVLSLRILNQIGLGYLKSLTYNSTKVGTNPAVVFNQRFRCWPVIFSHLNNASFFRFADLTRWRAFYSSGCFKLFSKGVVFIVVEQKASYYHMIMNSDTFIVETTVHGEDNKWLMYQHKFLQDPSTVKPGKEPKVYAQVECKGVLKHLTGKTARLTEVSNTSSFFQNISPEINETK